MTADISLVCTLQGFSMIVWALIALFHSSDLTAFAADFAFIAPAFWFLNAFLCGIAEITLASLRFPPGATLMLGTYFVTVWTWIAVTRPAASFSSGATHNLMVIIIGALMIHRSGRK